MKVSSGLCVCVAAAVLAGVSANVRAEDADPAPEGARPGLSDALSFDKMDADKDGKLTLEEYQAAMAELAKTRFKTLDTNADGAVSKEEMQKGRRGPRRPELGGRGQRDGDRPGMGRGKARGDKPAPTEKPKDDATVL